MKQFIFHINDTDDTNTISEELMRMASMVREAGYKTDDKLNDGWKRLTSGPHAPGYARMTIDSLPETSHAT